MNEATQTITPEAITLTAKDGDRLAATRFRSTGPLKGHIVVAGATGVRREFYTRFAEFVAHRGYTTLTLDYRGIGGSKPATLKGFTMNFLDWGTLDLSAAVDVMAHETRPLFLVGHSVGGHALGVLPNHHKVKGGYVFATGAGWHGYMPFMERIYVRLMWNIVLPVLTKWKGYSPWAMLGMGEDLPLDVYRQWRHWCTFPHYFFDDPEMPHMAGIYAKVTTPIVAANALDDKWATPRSRDAFMKSYTNAPVTRLDLDPTPFPGGIGHIGYFRKKAEPLWDDILVRFQHMAETQEQNKPLQESPMAWNCRPPHPE